MREKLLAIIEEETGERPEPSFRFDALGMDSLEYVDFIGKVEAAFGVQIQDKEMDFSTVGDLLAWLEMHLC
jgi:acyl carrier protein